MKIKVEYPPAVKPPRTYILKLNQIEMDKLVGAIGCYCVSCYGPGLKIPGVESMYDEMKAAIAWEPITGFRTNLPYPLDGTVDVS